MQNIPTQTIPNQEFSIVLDDNQWDITLKTTNGAVAVTLALNQVTVIENLRAVANTRIIPSEYEEAGNFAITTLNQAVPDYTQFGVTQNLIYISEAELEALRTPSSSPIITASDFDPLGALPLRFAPAGYVLA